MPLSINGSSGITGAVNVQSTGSVLAGVTTVTVGGVDAVKIDSNGRVGINTTNPDTTLEVFNGTLKVASTDALNRSITIDPGSNATYDSRMDASHSLVLRSYVAAGAGVKTCTFNTNGDLDLTGGRNLIFASGYGIDFSATANSSGTMTSELLADYEEGTFTPNLENTSGTGLGSSYNTRAGAYTKIGNVVYWNAYIDVGTNNASCTGNMRISGFPYSIKGAPSYADGFYIGFLSRVGTNLRGTTVLTAAYASSTALDLFYLNTSGNEARVQGGSDLVNPHIHMSGFYYVS